MDWTTGVGHKLSTSHPYRNGLALIGDAAGATDLSWGQGLGLAIHDAKLLSENLIANEDREKELRRHCSVYRGLFNSSSTSLISWVNLFRLTIDNARFVGL